jgi:hypothetical protein
VLHGALAVRKTGYSEPIAELRAGELVGEIGFFADVPRTADVIAIRDTSVLALTRPAYQKLVEEAPAIVEALLAALARRFAKETARIAPFPTSPKARTVALIDGGWSRCRALSIAGCARGSPRPMPRLSTPPVSQAMFPGRALDAHEVTEWLNKLEHTGAAGGLSRWPRRLAMGAQGDPSGRHGRVRVPRGGACRRIDRDSRPSPARFIPSRPDASSAFMTSEAARSPAPRPGWPGCRRSCITMSRSKTRSISTAWSAFCAAGRSASSPPAAAVLGPRMSESTRRFANAA